MEETKIGKCQWCEKHNVLLHFVIGQHDRKLWAGWICNDCLEIAHRKDWGEQYEKMSRS
ncbi:MAG: hypothetical protein J6Y78_15750 [Paludibacteraceae bacterium]|nr:hypothetical protein [Paludibacteraceae bacterium]